jgi:hypothetical protein
MNQPVPASEGAHEKQGNGNYGSSYCVRGSGGRAAIPRDHAAGYKGCCDEECRTEPKMARLVDHRMAMPVFFDCHRRYGDHQHDQGRKTDIQPANPAPPPTGRSH